jgi:hypothetical protein
MKKDREKLIWTFVVALFLTQAATGISGRESDLKVDVFATEAE